MSKENKATSSGFLKQKNCVRAHESDLNQKEMVFHEISQKK